jgi:cyanophycin synthetase
MKILATNVFVGPSLYAHFPVIRHQVDIGILEDWPSVKLGAGFIDRLIDALPGLAEHSCSYPDAGGFLRRLREDEGTWMAHIWEHAAIERHYNMVFAYKQRDVGLEAARIARQLLLSLLPERIRDELASEIDDDFDFEEERDYFIRFAQRKELGPSTASLVKAAEEREIPFLRLNKYSLVQFGHGRFQQRIQATITSKTPHIAVEISCDKEDTHNLLRDLGLPVPQQRLVHSEREAVRAARTIGYPVVVKPLDANHGRGVSINLAEDEQVATAYQVARENARGRSVLVESYIEGMDHRMLVINDELVAVAKRVPGHVLGDGKSTIAELVDTVNQDPRRGIGHEKVLTRLELDHQAERLMEKAGHDASTVLPEGEVFYLRSTANLSTGGTAIDLTDVVHPDNREMAVRAVQSVDLDVGGVDFLTQDITQSYKDVGGAIVEINAAPGFRMHVAPSEGEPRDVSGKVMEMLFPPGTPSRIPIASITGTNGKTTTSRMLSHILKTAGHTVGMTSTDGVYIDGRLSVKGDMTGPTSAHIVLRDPTVDVAVLETARGGLLRAGLGYRRCDVAACLNVASDHLGLKGINTLEQLAELKRIPIEVARNTAVLDADDEYCLRMADYTQADHLCYVTMNPAHSLVKEHIRAGGRAMVLEQGISGDMITLYDNGTHYQLLWTHLIPATMEGKATHNVQNAMFAAALAFGMGTSLEDIRHGLRTFDATIFQAPGRMNVFDELPFREDILAIARAAAGHYDHYICKADDNRRGRGEDEVPQMLRSQLLEEGVKEENIQVIPGEPTAVKISLEMAQEGDLVMIFGDDIERCWKQVTGFEVEGVESVGLEAEKPIQSFVEEDPMAFTLDPGAELIRDERGVRIARIDEESD